MSPQFLLALQAAIVIIGPLALGWWLRRHLGTSWRMWGWGALAFVGSQIARAPFLALLTVILNQLVTAPPSATIVFAVNLVVLAGTAGLFEETARWVVLRRLTPGTRGWRAALMFGAGHGGIEAILIVGGASVFNLVLLEAAEPLALAGRLEAPGAAALAAQLDALRNLHWWEPALSIWERITAITFHMAATVLVMQTVMTGNRRWWGLAVGLHVLLNAAVLVALRAGGIVAAELVATVCVLFVLYVIVRVYGAAGQRTA